MRHVSTSQTSKLSRTQFETDVRYQQAKEAEIEQEGNTILNHILKNLMIEAFGQIEMYLDSTTIVEAHAELLSSAMHCLQKGMQWCQRRDGFLALVTGRYTLNRAAVLLHDLGAELVKGRNNTQMQVCAG